MPLEIPSEKPGEIADFKFVDLSHHHPDFDVTKYTAPIFINKTSQGIAMVDITHGKRQRLCKEHGIKYGGYHFYECKNNWKIQLEHYFAAHGEFVLPPILDYEMSGGNTLSQLRANAPNAYLWMCEAEKRTGMTPILYIGYSLAKELGFGPEWKRFLPWFPRYAGALGAIPSPWVEADMFAWQFTESGTYPGIKDHCDISNYYGKNNRLKLKI